MKRSLLLVAVWLMLGTLPTMATVYTCSSVSEIRTAMSSVVAGDEIVITPGTYTASGVAASGTAAYFYGSANGTASNPITIRSQSSSNPATLSGNNVASLTVLRIVGDYWVVQDLILTTGQKGLIFDNANYCEAIDCEVHGIGLEGIHVRDGSDHVTIDGCKIYDTGNTGAGFGEGIYIGTDKGTWSSYDPYVDYTTVRNCEIGPDVRAEALDIKEGSTETVVEGCTFDASGLSGSNFADSFIDLKGTRCYIRCNTFNRNGESNLTKGIAAIYRSVALSSYEHSIHDNTFNMDASSGNMVEAYSGTSDIYGWSNTRVPSGDDYNSRVTTSCCPSWYSNPPACGSTPSCDAPSGLSTSGITTSSATLSWGSVSGSVDYDLRYRSVGSSSWTNVTGLSSASHTLTGLSDGTTYEWEVLTNCSGSSSSYASGSDFTTATSSNASTYVVYDDGLASDWSDFSYNGSYSLTHGTTVQVGSQSVEADYGSYGGVRFKKGDDLNLSDYTAIRFWVKSDGSHKIRVRLETNFGNKDVEFYTTSTWQQQTIELSEFDDPSSLDAIRFVNRSGSSFFTYYDQVEFVDLSVSRVETVPAATMAVMPNPVQRGNMMLLDVQVPSAETVSVALYDLQGRMILRQEIEPSTLAPHKLAIPSSLTPGVYLLRAQGQEIILTRRIVVQ